MKRTPLQQLREARGLSRLDVATGLGVTYVTIWRWEERTGLGQVTLETVEKLAKMLDVPTAALLP
jgi:transcriptional regulator with XRE-family HTH domain